MTRFILCIALFMLHAYSYGQEMRIDKSEENKEHVDRYLNKAKNHTDKDSISHYYRRALRISEKIKYTDGNLSALLGLKELSKDHRAVHERLRYPLMLQYFYDKVGTPNERAHSHYDLAVLYYTEGLHEKAIEVLERANDIKITGEDLSIKIGITLTRAYKKSKKLSDALLTASELEDRGNLTTEFGVAVYKEKAEIYHELSAYNEELGSYHKLLNLIKGTKYEYLSDITWNNIGYTEKYLGHLTKSQAAFQNVVKSKRTVSNDLMGTAYYNLGLNYQNRKVADSAIISLEKAESYLQKARKWEDLARCYNVQAVIFYQNDDYNGAQSILNEAFYISTIKNVAITLARSHEIQSDIHQDLFEYELALTSYKRYLSIRDSLAVIEGDIERARLFNQYRAEDFEQELTLIWGEQERRDIDEARQRAEKETADERHRAREAQAAADLNYSQLQAKGALDRLKVQEQRNALLLQQNELTRIQRENEIKELALEKERLAASEREKDFQLLEKKNELQVEKQRRKQEEFEGQLQLIFSVLFFIILILIGILFAYRQLRKRKKQIEEQSLVIIESKKLIEIEKEKSDSLLLNILPIAVAEELKLTGVSKPKLYEEVSVGFTDFAGFTMISEKLSPKELVGKLDEIFLEFDQIVENYGLQRIKTIGDAYMFASGLPVQIDDHAERCVRAGLDMRDYIEKHNQALSANELFWNLRIGINTGPVVAGVIGIKKFAYDIWGDTVNLAARMESSGEIKKVNISGRTHSKVKDLFDHEYRGKVHAKNKGDIDMYFVEYKK